MAPVRWPAVLFFCCSVLPLSLCCTAQTSQVRQFTVSDVSRLHALAVLGKDTNLSLLVEAGDMRFLEKPVTISERQKSFNELVKAILPGGEKYMVRRNGALKIIYLTKPAMPKNRILTLQLGRFSFTGKSVSSLSPLLAFQISQVTGCHNQGFAYSGPPMEVGIPNFNLRSATFEKIVAEAAKAPTPTMWVVLPDSGERGCISDAGKLWQVGTYSKYSGSPSALGDSIGPQLVH